MLGYNQVNVMLTSPSRLAGSKGLAAETAALAEGDALVAADLAGDASPPPVSIATNT